MALLNVDVGGFGIELSLRAGGGEKERDGADFSHVRSISGQVNLLAVYEGGPGLKPYFLGANSGA